MWNKGVKAVIAGILMLAAMQISAQQERDPTRPGKHAGMTVTEESGNPLSSRFTLNAIFYSSDRSQAIINKQVVTVGSHIQNAMVSHIGLDTVVMQIEEQGVTRETILRLAPHASVKRDASEDF